MHEELICSIIRHYRRKGRIFTYLVIADNAAYSDFYTTQELETLLSNCSLQVEELQLFGSVIELLQHPSALEEFAEQIHLKLCF